MHSELETIIIKSLMLYGIYVEYKLYRICNDYFVI